MFLVDRFSKPPVFNKKKINRELENINEFYNKDVKVLSQRRYDFTKASTIFFDIKPDLIKCFHGKCAFCETLLGTTGEVSNFRPKGGVTGKDPKEFYPLHYGWLAFEWSNLYYSCSVCRKSKYQYFPIEGTRAAIGEKGQKLLNEKPLLLDPCYDNPNEHLIFEKDGKVTPLTFRGEITIRTFNLNRSNLITRRKNQTDLLEKRYETLITFIVKNSYNDLKFPIVEKEIIESFNIGEEHLAAKCQYLYRQYNENQIFRSYIDSNNKWLHIKELLKSVSNPKPPLSHDYDKQNHEQNDHYDRNLFICRIETHNLKGLEDCSIVFSNKNSDNANWFMLLGENATGKTTFLQAIALTFMDAQSRRETKIKPNSFLRPGAQQGYMNIYLSNDEGEPQCFTLNFALNASSFRVNKPDTNNNLLILGYGSSRLIPNQRVKNKKNKNLQKLFDPFIPMINVKEWLCSLDKKNFDLAITTIKELLPIEKDTLLERDINKNEIFINIDRRITLDEISHGYKGIVALACDIMRGIQVPSSKIAEGIVLLDEIDAHLHPSWKMQIVKSLRKEFPHIQFLVTSHDPLCLRGLNQGEIGVLQKRKEGSVFIETNLPSPEGMRVDQILTSEYFGLQSTIDPDVNELFNKYYNLLSIKNKSKKQKEEIATIQGILDEYKYMGNSPRERLMYEIIDEYLAKQNLHSLEDVKVSLKNEVKSKIKNIWNRIEQEGEYD
ncbi:AAA family ATPase (plasmid) [Bacillus sp. H8-1]|nr:AAA family ATPase [Bacillus sp. H8-1]